MNMSENKMFKCDECDKMFSTKGNLKQHIKAVHNKIKDFKCEECDFVCSINGSLKRHIKMVHLKIKDKKCEECDYTCSTNGSLKQHIKAVHTKIKDFKCKECYYTCSTNGNLKKHIKIVHNKIKDFKCNECNYIFYTNGHLKRHMKTCTGELNCSSGEFQVMKTLDDMKITYKYNESYEVKAKKFLRWDFIIEIDNKKLFIEYNGRHHYEPVEFGGISIEKAEINYKKQIKHDKIKDNYCKLNNYPLLWISYKQFGEINKLVSDFIINNTTWGFEEKNNNN